MISLTAMKKGYGAVGDYVSLFEDVTLEIPTHRRLAILGAEASGKSVLIKVLSGLEAPSDGQIDRYAALSFPVGYSRALKGQLTARQNVEHVARLYGADPREVSEFVAWAASLGSAFDAPVRHLPQQDRAALAYAMAYATPFDTYLIDEHVGVGAPTFRARCQQMLQSRAETCGFIYATRFIRKARELCDCALVISQRKLVWFDNLEEGIAAYQADLDRREVA